MKSELEILALRASRDKTFPAGEIYMLGKIHWDFFVTIALPHRTGLNGMSAKEIWKDFSKMLVDETKIRPEKLMSVVSLEHGSSRGNPHLHVLISGPFRGVDSADFIGMVAAIAVRMDLPSVLTEAYDDRRNGISYIFKEQNKPNGLPSSSNGDWPSISGNVWRAIRRRPDMR